MGDADGSRHRDIDQLAELVGRYCWLEHRLFVLTGTAASAPAVVAGDPGEAECRVWFAAASRRHGALAAGWTGRMPVRAGVDRDALVLAPARPLPGLLDDLATAATAEPARGWPASSRGCSRPSPRHTGCISKRPPPSARPP